MGKPIHYFTLLTLIAIGVSGCNRQELERMRLAEQRAKMLAEENHRVAEITRIEAQKQLEVASKTSEASRDALEQVTTQSKKMEVQLEADKHTIEYLQNENKETKAAFEDVQEMLKVVEAEREHLKKEVERLKAELAAEKAGNDSAGPAPESGE